MKPKTFFIDDYEKYSYYIDKCKQRSPLFPRYIRNIYRYHYYEFLKFCLANNEIEVFKKAKNIKQYKRSQSF